MKQFVSREELAEVMHAAGLRAVEVRDLNFGTVCIHLGVKPDPAVLEGTP
jgi:ubiquinone/menaquinone biosynthesis C-methylase UbiE